MNSENLGRKSGVKRSISLSIILLGFTAMASQIVFMRELLVLFYGNELSIGLILASWLAGGAIGSAFFGRFTDRAKFKVNLFLYCLIALTILLPFNIIVTRLARSIIHINPGEIMPLLPMAVSSFIILVPVCALLGFLFILACRIYDTGPFGGAVSIGNVYVLEAVGAVAGGLLTSFVMTGSFSSLEIMGVLGILNLVSSFAILFTIKDIRFRTALLAVSNLLLAGLILMWPLKGWSHVDRYSLAKQWQGYRLIASENSIYGNVAITEREGQHSFFDNGLHLYTIPDRQSSEEAVHYALLEHRDPKDVLLIGGGVGGLAEEVLKYPIDRCDYVELDPLIIGMAQRYLPEEYRKPLEDSRIYIHNTDGRAFLKDTGRKYDCIIVDIGDPYTAQINRFYTVEFFKEARKALRDDGIISFGLASSENYISPPLGRYLRSVYTTLKEAFVSVKVIPGDTAYFLASNKKDSLSYDYAILMDRARDRKLDIKYVREYYLSSKLSSDRIAYVERSLKEKGRVNMDFRPISYYYATIFWTSRFRDSFVNIALTYINEKKIWQSIVLACLTVLLFWLLLFRDKRRFEKSALLALSFIGFGVMSAQVVILLSFQIIFGFLYYKLGLILTSFMIGLALGGNFAVKMISVREDAKAIFMVSLVALIAYFLILPLSLSLLAKSVVLSLAWTSSNIIFPLISVAAGFLGGFQFPVVNKIYLTGQEGRVGKVAGLTYGVDLLGSCFGAFLTGAILVPVAGIPKTCLASAMLNAAALIIVFFSSQRKNI